MLMLSAVTVRFDAESEASERLRSSSERAPKRTRSAAAHAADADAEGIDQWYDDHACSDGQRGDRAAERVAGGVDEFLHFFLRNWD